MSETVSMGDVGSFASCFSDLGVVSDPDGLPALERWPVGRCEVFLVVALVAIKV